METTILKNISLNERFPIPPVGIIYKEANKTYLPPIEKKNKIYWIAGITVFFILSGAGIYYLFIYPSEPQPVEKRS